MKRNNKNITALFTVIILMSLCLSGCMEAGAEDWVGAKPVETEETEEPSSEEPVT